MPLSRAVIPIEGNQNPVQLSPASIALARTLDTTISSSTQVDFNAASTFIRVFAGRQGLS